MRLWIALLLAGLMIGGCSKKEEAVTVITEKPPAPPVVDEGTADSNKEEAGSMADAESKPGKSGIVTTDSGLKYEELKVGAGATPKQGDIVVVHYTGWLTDGTKFDSSKDRSTPFEFSLGRGEVIPGWDEGLSTMKVGGKRKLTVPPDLGYGDRGMPPVIPPKATLVFEVELLKVR